ncbi:carbohydrate sulfotransferase 8 isoform X2 [Procambarus clarkii]|uniref:carbohydrate sulfotransferase 8 isoform X2 n=1 Tax=Procambarus clarkii TaxID=6728 RepID=UPI00374469A8
MMCGGCYGVSRDVRRCVLTTAMVSGVLCVLTMVHVGLENTKLHLQHLADTHLEQHHQSSPSMRTAAPLAAADGGGVNTTAAGRLAPPQRLHNKHPDQYQRDQVLNLTSSWTEEECGRVAAVMSERRRVLEAACQQFQTQHGRPLIPNLSPVYYNLFSLPDYNIVWCPIFKSASTTWVKNLLLLAGQEEVEGSLHARARQIYTLTKNPKERQGILSKARKMIIVRHPLDRLLSAYRDKMLRFRSYNGPHEKLQRAISTKYLDPNPARKDSKISSGSQAHKKDHVFPSFSQFLMKVKDDAQNACFDMYNKTSEATHHYFSQVPLSLLQDVVKLYQPDFALFGYSPQPYYDIARAD